MERQNQSTFTEFLLLGFSDRPTLQLPLFILFLLMYLITLLGNTLIITLVYIDCRLHVPMYILLCNLSFFDVCYTSVSLPKLMEIHLMQHKIISFAGCMTQFYFFSSFVIAEYYILAMMAFDRYVAICKPLHYTVIMTRRLCFLLSSISWAAGFLSSIALTALLSGLSFCFSNVINHLVCEVKPLMKLSCSDTSMLETVIYVEAVVCAFSPFTLICSSYFYIISTIIQIHSNEGRRKAFSTCSSHLTIVCLFCGILICTYIGPTSKGSRENDKVLALLYSTVIPMLNPIIYSLRNRQVKRALTDTDLKEIIGDWPKITFSGDKSLKIMLAPSLPK
ncbi:olfactory receptor 5AR1-like [Ambystoma mexicanum]|uniref:olfactory receptor 5AR1-like n=1 Tax=Ambystoma mexicanum TaxID=8296 RepID=UPI0037E83F9E